MKYFQIYILLTIITFSIGCKKHQEYNTELLKVRKNLNDSILKDKVIITGTSDAPKALKYFLILSDYYLFGGNHKYSTKKISNDSLYIELDSINQLQVLDLWIIGDTTHYAKIFVKPGDTLTFKIENLKLEFTGKKSDYNNLFTALYTETLDYGKNPYTGNIINYKENAKTIYNQKLALLDQNVKENNLLSNDYILLIKDILKFDYLYSLIQPRNVLSEKGNYYFTDGKGVLSVIENEYKNKENLFDFNAYMENATIEDFNRPDLLENSHAFKNAFDSFIRFYFVQNDYLKYTKESFLAEKDFIQKNFDGELQNYAIARMIREYHVNGFGFSEINLALMKGLIKEYEDKFTKPSYKEKMEEFLEELNNFNFTLSKYALQSKLINPVGDTTKLGEVFRRTSKKIKVIDFWASWCPPCIREIEKAKDFKDELSEVNNVEWIYISIDKDYDKWLKKILELQEYFNTENQYYLLGGQNSSLGKYLKVRGIPRYVIFNKQEKIVLDNAPRPSDSIVFKRVIDDINLKK